MSLFKGRNIFTDRVRNFFDKFPKITIPIKAITCAGIQVAGGVALTAYTYEHPTYRILPFVYSAIAIGGTYNIFKILLEKYGTSVHVEPDSSWASWDLAHGALTYSTGVYAFSEGLKLKDKILIPSLGVAVSGYYFSTSAVDNLAKVFNEGPFLKFCLLLFEPALIASAYTYLLHFQNHRESSLNWLVFVILGTTGFNIAADGFSRADSLEEPEVLLFKVIQIMMGGCLLTVSSIVLTVYSSANDFHPIWTIFMFIVTFFGAFLIFGSLTCFRRYINMEPELFLPLAGMLAGPFTFFCACFTTNYVDNTDMVFFMFLFLAGLGHFLLCRSVYQIYKIIPGQRFRSYYQRILGPVMTVYSSLAASYVAYSMGWRFSLMLMPFVPAGIYVTYRGFKKRNESITGSIL